MDDDCQLSILLYEKGNDRLCEQLHRTINLSPAPLQNYSVPLPSPLLLHFSAGQYLLYKSVFRFRQ